MFPMFHWIETFFFPSLTSNVGFSF